MPTSSSSNRAVPGRRYKASRFNAMRTFGTRTVMGNSYSGAVAAFDVEEATIARSAMKGTVLGDQTAPLVIDMIEAGFLVDDAVNELARVHSLHATLNDQHSLGLIIMPTEDCNFRCIYCYESFAKKAMKRPVRDGVKAMLDTKVPKLDILQISWFGGEPLFAFDVMRELGEHALALCERYGTQLVCGITTNAYMLDQEKVDFLLATKTRHFQITVDGDRLSHDRSRHLNGGGETFDVIWKNLLHLQSLEAEIDVAIRVNVDQKNYGGAKNLVQMFTDQFGTDSRFTLNFHSIWNHNATASDDVVPLDGQRVIYDLKLEALAKNPRDCLGFRAFGGGARYCYASKANSLVIGSDGNLYKCTVAFENPQNLVGKLHADGTLEIDDDRFALWTAASDYRDDSDCRKCFYVPSCLGASCPLVRIEQGQRPCPSDKLNIGDTMQLYAEMTVAPEPADQAV
jgi:uncharacterized protein